ncbi:hypothetical protein DVDV_0579 [Desulfovibrio sp. DV]|uniref:TadE/TadG family type IV pilus assembly protein n=1 Tax=Desulfovibrio sp. DV TaxID=1844708 RepID=UPI00094BB8EF|nr:hypothetical protein [Desulfovibrio sp. DV]OLN30379.1 hypothetical protein DVDV_0579 [Desulfovibrio sp. DV]
MRGTTRILPPILARWSDAPALRRPGRPWRTRPCPPGSRKPFGRNEAGAATVEFAFALMFILFLFVASVNISEIFLAHSRLRYATFVASRVQAVGGSAEAAASEIDKDFRLKITSDTVSAQKTVALPQAVGTLFGTGQSFTISHAVKTFVEPTPSGDNAAK